MTNHSFKTFSDSLNEVFGDGKIDEAYIRRLINEHFEVIEFDEEQSRLLVKSEGAGHKDILVLSSMFSGAFSFAFLLMACVGTMNAFAAVSVGVLCAALSFVFYRKAKNCPHFHIELFVGSAEATISLNAERQKVVLDEKTLTLASYQAYTGPLRHSLHLNTTFKNRNYFPVTKGATLANIAELMILQTMLTWRLH